MELADVFSLKRGSIAFFQNDQSGFRNPLTIE